LVDLAREIRTVLRTGRVIIGSKQSIRAILHGKPKLVIIAANAPRDLREEVERYCKLADIPVYVFPGTSWDLGAMCGRPHMVAVLSVIDPGESSIMEVVERERGG